MNKIIYIPITILPPKNLVKSPRREENIFNLLSTNYTRLSVMDQL